MSHGSAGDFLRRFWIVTFLLIPLALTNDFIAGIFGIGALVFGKWVQLGLATVIFYFSLVFFKHASHEIKTRKYGMMTLVSLAVGAGYLFSVVSTFIPSIEVEFYLEISTLIWVLLFGHYLEAKSSAAAGTALQEVAKLLPKKAHKQVDDKEEDVDIETLKEGDTVLVKPGEKIPADGIVVSGSANVNEALISGESKPIKKSKGGDAIAGAICLDGSLTIKLTRVGEHSTIGKIQKLIAKAQETKPKSQRIADKAAAILTFTAGISALITLGVWTLIVGEPFVFAATLAITVLVIACPHALGLAIPTVTTITTSLAVKNGIFLKDLSKIEIIRKADYVVFDKTGTLTDGSFGVSEVKSISQLSEDEILSLSAAIDSHSSHVIAQSIFNHAKQKNLELKTISNFQNIAGKGVKAEIGEQEYFLGNEALMQERGLYPEKVSDGSTTVFLASQNELLGLIKLSDKVKKEAHQAIDSLHKLGVKVAILTGDNEAVAKIVAGKLKIDTYFAGVLPEDKYKHIKKLQDEGNVVLMVGDGVNDAPALTQSDAGVAIGAGTDVAVEAGDVVLTRSNPVDLYRLVVLSKKVYRKMIQNLIWALGYNIVAIPAAAGVFAYWGFFLRPEIGALVMSLSTVIVVANAMTLKLLRL